jgi:hypothetical protein
VKKLAGYQNTLGQPNAYPVTGAPASVNSLPAGILAADSTALASAGNAASLINSAARRNRAALVGDSLLAYNYLHQTIPTTAGSFVVSNGVATVNTTGTGNHSLSPGNYFHLFNSGDATWALDPMNGTCPLVTSVSSATVFTFATTAPNGDYSAGYNGTVWSFDRLHTNTDSGVFNWLNNYNRGQWIPWMNYAVSGTKTTDVIGLLPKILAGPAFDEVILSTGVNDIAAAPNTTAAEAAAITAFNNLTQTIIPAFLKAGKRIVVFGPPAISATFVGASYLTIACANLRRALKEWCYRYPSSIRYLDLYADTVLGTSTVGDVVPNYIAAGDIHPQTTGAVNIAQFETPIFAGWFPQLDLTTVTVLEDTTTYSQPGAPAPNIVPHGGFDGTSGALVTGITGSLATGWTGLSGAGCVATGGSAKTAVANSNSVNWGFCQDLVFSGTAPSAVIFTANLVSQLVANTWYRAGFTVTPIGAQTGLQQLFGTLALNGTLGVLSPGNMDFNKYLASFNNGLPVPAGVPFEIVSPPIWYSSKWAPTSVFFFITAIYAGAASGHLQLSNAWMRAMDNPAA